MTPEEFSDKVDYEGGVIDALEYGLKPNDLDDSNMVLKRKWVALCAQWADFKVTLHDMEQALETVRA